VDFRWAIGFLQCSGRKAFVVWCGLQSKLNVA